MRHPPSSQVPPMRKREDVVLLKGEGCFADDVALERPLQIAFVRSMAVGSLTVVDTEEAAGMPGVRGVYVAQDVADLGALSVNPVMDIAHLPAFPVLAAGRIAAVGQPVAAVIADTLAQALDAAEAVLIEIGEETPIPNTIAAKSWQDGDVEDAFARAAHVVSCQIDHPRLAPSPLEPRAIAAQFNADTGGITLWHATQTPHRTRSELAQILGVDAALIRVIAQHVGGAFGMKASLYPEEVFVAWAALRLARDIRWTATRSEDFLAATHGRGITSRGSLAVDAQGRFLALRANVTAPLGPWLPNSALIPAWNAGRILPSGYDVPAVQIETTAVQTGHGPTGIYRGAGRPEANALMERLIDKAARVLGHDPVALRRANLLAPEALPTMTATGQTLDSGQYGAALEQLCTRAGYADWCADRDAKRARGLLSGVGLAFYVEPSGNGWESARVTLQEDSRVLVASGSSSQGHARETAFAAIASQVLDVPAVQIDVVLGDTALAPEGIGALASRSTAIGGSAVLQACQQVAAIRQAGTALPVSAEVRYENDGQAWGYGA